MTMMLLDQHRYMVGWTQPNSEFVVASKLREIGFDAFVPSVRNKRPVKCWSRNRGHGKTREEIIILPAFPRYMIFSTTNEQPAWGRALSAQVTQAGMTVVVRRIGNLAEPGILPSSVVAMLRGPSGDGVIEDKANTVEAIRRFSAGQHVTVERAGVPIPGVVVGHEGRDVRVILSVLGGHREAMVSPESVEAA